MSLSSSIVLKPIHSPGQISSDLATAAGTVGPPAFGSYISQPTSDSLQSARIFYTLANHHRS